ncbi:MAG: hypothetical protein GX573_24175 [Chloroflexi bacterium]|nr:hypothetical protein [Chloroflexota bacterium]
MITALRAILIAMVGGMALFGLVDTGASYERPVAPTRAAATSNRWVMNTERGFIFGWPNSADLPGLGALVFMPQNTVRFASQMQPEALKIPQGRVTLFSYHDQYDYAWFPWNEFVAYNDAEIAAGRPSMLITAGGQPVVAFADEPNGPRQAVNIGDDRFINFWINEYVRKRLFANPATGEPYPYANMWVGIDNAIFMQGIFTPSTGWDAPFPQSEEEYRQAAMHFFRRVKELAPDIHVMANNGSLADENAFRDVFANIDGLMAERFPHVDLTDGYLKADSLKVLRRLIWFGEQGRVTMVKSIIPMDNRVEEHVRNAYMAYLIARGDNSFFGPHAGQTADPLPEGYYAEMQQVLGWHTGPAQEIQPNVWTRQHQGGIVYLNWSDAPVTLAVSEGYVDRAGAPVTEITIPANSGDYVAVIRPHDLP